MVNDARRSLILAGILTPFAARVFGATSNPITLENVLTGDADWRVSNYCTFFDWSTQTYGSAPYTEIEGYASAHSVNLGETIRFYVNCQEPSYTLKVYRLGWYGGQGARLLHTVTLPGVAQPIPSPDALGTVECNWTEALALPIPTSWTSGIYFVKMITGSSGVESYMSFIVRDDARQVDFIFQSAYNTSQAYNNWGGKSLYEFNSKNGAHATAISFNRPDVDGEGCGQIMHWELSMARFLEREGYNVKYIANIDVHTDATKLLKGKAFFSVGHDEYWSYEQKANVQAAQALGIHTAFFSANTCYWQVRFLPSTTGQLNRTMLSYKYYSAQDPFVNGDRKRITTQWRELTATYGVVDPVAQPENAMIGVQYHGDPVNSDLVCFDPSHWIFAGTNAVKGTKFVGLLGYETDSIFNNGFNPPGIKKIMQSPDPFGFSHSTYFTMASGAAVFASGTMQWSWGVDFSPSWAPNSGINRATAAFQQLNRNLMTRFLLPALAQPKNVTAVVSPGKIVISWTTVIGAVSYDVYRSTTSNAALTTPYKTGVNAATVADTAVSQGVAYYYAIVARAGVADSLPSIEISAIGGASGGAIAQTITFGTLATKMMGDAPFSLSANASSGLAVTFTSLTPTVCTVSGSIVTLVGAGLAKIAANQAGNSQYLAAPQITQQFTVTAAQQGNLLPPKKLTGYSCDVGCWAVSQGVGIRINWTQSSSPGIVTNTIWRGDGTTGQIAILATIPAGILYIDKTVLKNKMYHYRVSATNNLGVTSALGNDTAVKF